MIALVHMGPSYELCGAQRAMKARLQAIRLAEVMQIEAQLEAFLISGAMPRDLSLAQQIKPDAFKRPPPDPSGRILFDASSPYTTWIR